MGTPRERFLSELRAKLHCQGRGRRDVLDELEQHILDAVEAGEDERAVVGRIGDVALLARALNAEVARDRTERRLIALTAVVSAALVATALPLSVRQHSHLWAWSASMPGTAATAPAIALSAANAAGVDTNSLREVVAGRTARGSSAVLAGRDASGRVCFTYTADTAVASLYRCVESGDPAKAVLLFASRGGATSQSVVWTSVSGVARADVAGLKLRRSDGGERDLSLNPWRGFTYYADSLAAMPRQLVAYAANGRELGEFDFDGANSRRGQVR